MAFTVPINMLGLRVAGDLGGITIYTDRFNQKVAYPIDHPKKPPSPAQLALRARFKDAQAAWAALSAGEKATLELAVDRASLVMTGQNLFISAALTKRHTSYQAVADQVKLTLPPLPNV